METWRSITVPAVDQAGERIRREFLALPGLRLSLEQAERVWSLDEPACARVLDALVAARFLAHEPDGSFRRADVPPQPGFHVLPGRRAGHAA
jgi:hypothetical protein